MPTLCYVSHFLLISVMGHVRTFLSKHFGTKLCGKHFIVMQLQYKLSFLFRPFYYDPYAAFGPHPVPPLPPHLHHPPAVHPGHHVAPYYYTESGICEFVLVSLALCLWLYSFYRLYLVWQNTLNFSESSIQGPQVSSSFIRGTIL